MNTKVLGTVAAAALALSIAAGAQAPSGTRGASPARSQPPASPVPGNPPSRSLSRGSGNALNPASPDTESRVPNPGSERQANSDLRLRPVLRSQKLTKRVRQRVGLEAAADPSQVVAPEQVEDLEDPFEPTPGAEVERLAHAGIDAVVVVLADLGWIDRAESSRRAPGVHQSDVEIPVALTLMRSGDVIRVGAVGIEV